MSGRVVHFEIPYDDKDRANAFYTEAFGWKLNGIPEMRYVLASTGPGDEGPSEPGFINGGLLQREPPVGGPLVVVDVDDIDVALKQIETLGGTTMTAKQPVGDMGFAAYFKDTEGNVIGLWETA